MTAVSIPAPQPLEAYRDDGPVARAIGSLAGGALDLPAAALLLVAGLPLALAIALEGDAAGDGAAAGAIAWAVLLGGAASGRPAAGRFAWAAPPLVRLIEYAGLIWLASLAGDDGPPSAFALVAVVAFRHYDIVYRLRHQGRLGPAWVGSLAGGWDGRLLAGVVLLAAGALPAGFYVAAGALGVVFVAESVHSWTRQVALPRPALDDEDEEEEGG